MGDDSPPPPPLPLKIPRTASRTELRIDAFGPPGSIVTGTFSGKLYDEDGKLHEITDGVFSVPRVDRK